MTKRKSKSKLRIQGLVRFMNYAREQISAGVPAEQQDDFRALVADGVQQVERICRQHRCTPRDLPAPSRRAYRYLKGLDLDNIPERAADQSPAPHVRVSGIISTVNYYQSKLADLARQQPAWEPTDAEVVDLASSLRGDADAIAGLCEEQHGRPAHLPIRSRRGYQWLRYLSAPETLAQHLTALSTVLSWGKKPHSRQHLPASHRERALHVQFYVSSALWRTRLTEQYIDVALHEGFIGAPDEVLRALMHAALGHEDDAYQHRCKAYAVSEPFADVTTDLAMTTAELSTATQGQHYDLAEVFERVNNAYFDGQLDRPRLVWNKTLTERKMGHYNAHTDTLMLSITLDAIPAPRYVIDYVMYHELLHKKFGVSVVNGRRYAHTPEFRAAEEKFARHDEAEAYLAQMRRKFTA